MRVIVGRDYYDSAMAHGRSDVVFVRERNRDIPVKQAAREGLVVDHVALAFEDARTGKVIRGGRNPGFQHRDASFDLSHVAAIVCGRKHNGLAVRCSRGTHPTPEGVTRCFWDLDDFRTWFAERGLVVQDDKFPWWRRESVMKLDAYFGKHALSALELDFVMGGRITLMTYLENDAAGPRWRVNADNLEAIQFYKAMDAYTLFQEIEMWVGGTLGCPARPLVEISDEIRLAKHGFDKWSFRKPKRLK